MAACGRENRNVQLLSAPWKRFTGQFPGGKNRNYWEASVGLCAFFLGVFIAANLHTICETVCEDWLEMWHDWLQAQSGFRWT